jgi:hypothetical protein
MKGIDHLNVLLFLLACEDVNKVQECLLLPSETTDILILLYIFVTQSKKKGLRIRRARQNICKCKTCG